MSNEEERKCPLCAEEMDWTDQQFKPCKCGYQVCIWCWHHMMDMAEKDATEGRCPACRNIYEKEKVVAMQANCARATTNNSVRKSKLPKAKSKSNEVKKDLTNVRVIQRKMAYVIGLPLNLADEDLLQRKEYFGQYGKVCKVSLSRTAGGAIQQFINDTCSVYITYSKEEEAIRCIQSVHGFVLEDRYLRASFGTAKYCHAWLRNLPCSNPSCLYLHSVGAEEDSFGKDEVAAIHTRNRVQQIVGGSNNMIKRSGNILPPPVDEICHSDDAMEKHDTSNGNLNTSTHMACTLTSKDKEGSGGGSSKTTSFVDIVGRPNSSDSESDGNIAEHRSLNLGNDITTVTVSQDTHGRELYSDAMLSRVSSSNPLVNQLPPNKKSRQFSDDPLQEDSVSSNGQGSTDSHSSNKKFSSIFTCYPTNTMDDSSGVLLLHEDTCSSSNLCINRDAVRGDEDEASLPFTCVNAVLSDGHELKFQSSAKSDRIYRGSNSFSNEEIVEHLRRIDDGNLTNADGNSTLDAVESSIISDIMSMGFDSCNNSSSLPHNLTGLLGKTDARHGSSWNSHNNDKSGFSFAKQDRFASQVADLDSSFSSIQLSNRSDFGGSRDHFLHKPQYQVTKHQSLAPPGFSMPSRETPPGFSACSGIGFFQRSASGSQLVNSASWLQTTSAGSNGNLGDVGSIDPAILSCSKGKPSNGRNNSIFDIGPASALQTRTFEDEARLWLLMNQSTSIHQDSQLSHIFAPQNPSTYPELRHPGRGGECFPALDDRYNFSSRIRDQHQSYDPSFALLSQQKFVNGQVSNGYYHNLDEIQLRNQVGIGELQGNERFGMNKYLPGRGDLIYEVPCSGDLYTRLFGM